MLKFQELEIAWGVRPMPPERFVWWLLKSLDARPQVDDAQGRCAVERDRGDWLPALSHPMLRHSETVEAIAKQSVGLVEEERATADVIRVMVFVELDCHGKIPGDSGDGGSCNCTRSP